MKKSMSIFLIVCIALAFASCTQGNTPSQPPTETEPLLPTQTQSLTPTPTPSEIVSQKTEPDGSEPFEGKIAVITIAKGANDDWESVLPVISKYGDNKVVHKE